MPSLKSDYLHVIAGRLRVKVLQVKRCPVTADRVRKQLEPIEGVTGVDANPITGNVLVYYESHLVDHRHILETLTPFDIPRKPISCHVCANPANHMRHKVVEELAPAGFVALIKFSFRFGLRAVAAVLT